MERRIVFYVVAMMVLLTSPLMVHETAIGVSRSSMRNFFETSADEILYELDTHEFGLYINDIDVQDGFCYAVSRDDGLVIVDVSDPEELVEVASYPTLKGHDIRVRSDGSVAVIVNVSLVYTLDISNPLDVLVLDVVDTGSTDLDAMDATDDFAYVDGQGPFRVIDIRDPTNISITNILSIANAAQGIAATEDVVYVSRVHDGFSAVNVTDPSSVSILWTRDPASSEWCWSMSIAGDLLWIGDQWYDRVFLYNVSSPIPVFQDSFDTYAQSITAVEHFLFAGTTILDASNPSSIVSIGSISQYRSVYSNDVLFTLTTDSGDSILHSSEHDLDEDDLYSLTEADLMTDAFNSDSDSDTMTDGWEHAHGLDPTTDDSLDDLDGDLLTNIEEFNLGTFPDSIDTDEDMAGDYDEVNVHGTDPTDPDSDQDTMTDGWEILYGLNPLVNDADGDLDNDTLTNAQEFQHGTRPDLPDTDSDSMPDWWEVEYLLKPTTDDADEDKDLDGSTNLEEFLAGTNPNDHGLRWAVVGNTTLSFTLTAEHAIDGQVQDIVEESILVQVETIPEVPVVVDHIPGVSFVAVWASNLSMFNLNGFFSIQGVPLAVVSPAVPYGNWTILTEAVWSINSTSESQINVIQTDSTWGISIVDDSEYPEVTSETVWYKSDGTLEHVRLEIVLSDTETIDVQLTRTGTDNMTLMIVASGGAAVMAVIALVIIRKRRA